jgi:hypothetical protein
MVLRWTRLGEERVVTCQNCGFVADKARPRLASLSQLRERLWRERRRAPDRRTSYVIELLDPRERRLQPRRIRRRVPL